ncbi:SulP family inorganic anion transporter [uncultured Aquabacterium sp.]|jgi:SulP family sulfate permease|uniref:SulP family inorganic anion transporter n=1 Tax=uncultured Aquabacterium sp. TaxID=158753 RepID=UPI00260D3740|nr:SulP family inorganic anion transporter [uncultured Aquabacterium sp.]
MPARAPVIDPAPWSWPPPWLRQWQRADLHGDVVAGLVVAVMLVPQSLAYAMLAGLPVQAGLLASVLPLVAYAAFGSSRAMSVGPAAITSLMVAQTLSPLAQPGSAHYQALAWCLALGSAVVLGLMGWRRLGFLSQLLSGPVVQGFTVASAALILVGQAAPLVGWAGLGHTLPDMARALTQRVQAAAWPAWGDAAVGLATLSVLMGGRPLAAFTGRVLHWPDRRTDVLGRLWPLVGLLAAVGVAQLLEQGLGASVHRVGAVSLFSEGGASLWPEAAALAQVDVPGLLVPVLLISLVGFVSSMSVAQTFALRQGDRVDADRELLGLGAANLGSTLLGGMPVSGGLSRSVVNEAAGARSPLSGLVSAGVLVVMLAGLLPALALLPKAALAAVIMMAVSGLLTLRPLREAARTDRSEAGAFVGTAIGVLLVGFEAGILLGMAWSIGAMIWRHSQPHVAEVGRLPGTEHFRNVQRHQVERLPGAIWLRVDDSLDFTNIQRVEQALCALIQSQPEARNVVVLMSAVNHVDHTAGQALLAFDAAQQAQGRTLWLAEIKGPVMDRLQTAGVAARFEGRILRSGQDVWLRLASVEAGPCYVI